MRGAQFLGTAKVRVQKASRFISCSASLPPSTSWRSCLGLAFGLGLGLGLGLGFEVRVRVRVRVRGVRVKIRVRVRDQVS